LYKLRMNEKIRTLLTEGQKVHSCAAGRVGEVVAVDDHPLFPVTIRPKGRKLTGATTFDVGDPVKLQWRDDGCLYVVNKPGQV
jgi:hypothetical protein